MRITFFLLLGLLLQINYICKAARISDGDEKAVVSLLVLLPLTEESLNSTLPWDRGPEILPGGQLAVDQINNSSSILLDCTLELHVVSIDRCRESEFTANINATIPLADIAAGISDILGLVTGPFCPPLLRRLISPLASRDEISLFQISGTTSVTARSTNRDALHFITPSLQVHYQTLYSMMRKFKWTKVFVLAEKFFKGATSIRGSEDLNITFREINYDLDLVFNDLRRSMKKIVFASVGVENAVGLLCAAHKTSLIYPNYVWIFHDLTPSDLMHHNHMCSAEALQQALHDAIFLRFPFQQNSPTNQLESGDHYKDYYLSYLSRLSPRNLQPNIYANIMYDSVWAFALTLNASLTRANLSLPAYLQGEGKKSLVEDMNGIIPSIAFEGASGSIKFSEEEVNGRVEITFGLSTNPQGKYVYATGNISLDDSLFSDLPTDELESRYNLIFLPLALTLAVVAALCLVMTTVILALFIWMRNDSDIKAASPHLSYIMFLGCYLLFASALLHSLTGAFPVKADWAVYSVCGVVIAGDSLGVNLIFTTLLLRMLRIYRVFSYFGKMGKLWSDKVMFLIIVLVVVGDIALILVWSLVDTFRVIEVILYQPRANPPFYEIRQFCHSEHLSLWLGILLGKLGILFAIVLFLAFKTRKIQRSNFKDTKKVNIYIFCTILIVILPMGLHPLLRSINSVLGVYLTIYVVFGLVGFLCQLFLFLPKVITPILKRHGYEVSYDSTRRRATLTKRPSKSAITNLAHSTIISSAVKSSPSMQHNTHHILAHSTIAVKSSPSMQHNTHHL